jgi:D-3-phosphoglycerate dehydrogenase
MKKFSVLVTDRLSAEALAYLRAQTDLEVKTAQSFEPSAEELHDVQALLIRSRTKINSALLSQAPALKVVVTMTSGFDHIQFAATTAQKVVVMHTPQANAASASELTWALVLAAARRIPEAHKAVKAGEWRRDALNGVELSQKNYGVIGLGRIGLRVAHIAQAFGMKVSAYDPYKDDEHFSKHSIARLSLEEILKLSDVLSLHVPATPETHHMLNRTNLEYASRDLILVNTSRGQAVHEHDLCEALDKGWIRAAGLDVFEHEPLPRHSPLLKLLNLVLSPHLGATTSEAFAKASQEGAQKLLLFLRSGQISDSLPPNEPWFVA